MLEHLWWAARVASWFPRWVWFQALAVAVGAAIVAQRGTRPLLAYAVGVASAALGALALGCAGGWLRWLTQGGPPAAIEVAGFGAIGGLVLGHVVAARLVEMPAAILLDGLASAFGAILTVARTGCFFAGCDFGAPTRLPWALAYPPITPAFRAQVDAGLIPETAQRTLPVHPTQLYAVLLGPAMIAVAVRPRARPGERFALAALAYGVGRLVVDTMRGDLDRVHGITLTQALAGSMIGTVLVWRATARRGELQH